MERRLSAILAVDVVGYARQMRADEEGTLAALHSLRRELFEPLLVSHHGRLVKLMGDGALVEFASVVDAVRCATAIQQGAAERARGVPEDRRIVLRIGINLGDVIVAGRDIYGDGVNVAARVEALAPPGGIVVTGTVVEHVAGRLDCAFEDLGERTLKNIRAPVRVHAVRLDGRQPEAPRPERPTIAVLPFDNMSGDPEQAYFSDGLTEDLITDLSKVSGLAVAARHTSFSLRDARLPVPEIARRLQVRHVLEGSVRKAGGRVRITAQLSDGETGDHLWAQRYDRELADIFAVQDELTRSIVGALKVRLLPDERAAIATSPTADVEAYQLVLRGHHLLASGGMESHIETARRLFVVALVRDPGCARAFAGLAECDCAMHQYYGRPVSFDDVLALSDKAMAIDPMLADAHAARGHALAVKGHLADAEIALGRALDLNPTLFQGLNALARLRFIQDRKEEAAGLYRQASEVRPDNYHTAMMAGQCCREIGAAERARTFYEDCLARVMREIAARPENANATFCGAVALVNLGRVEEALAWVGRALALEPDDAILQYNVACVRALSGDVEGALELLQRMIPHASADRLAWLAQDTDFTALRADPRFQALLRCPQNEP